MNQKARFTATPHTDALIDLALSEDIGCGDATGDALIPFGAIAEMNLVARETLVLCGQPVVDRVIQRFGPTFVEVEWAGTDGQVLQSGERIATLRGLLSELLILERTVLNFLQRMSGVATLTRHYVDAIKETDTRLVDTRKTLPAYRSLDKYATRVGGAANHRVSLDGGILIKENHLVATGGIEAAIASARQQSSHSLRIEVEVENESEFEQALRANADVIMLDNFSPDDVRKAVLMADGKAVLEASGGITLDNIAAYADTGVNLIAVGAITHSATAVDIAAEVIYGKR